MGSGNVKFLNHGYIWFGFECIWNSSYSHYSNNYAVLYCSLHGIVVSKFKDGGLLKNLRQNWDALSLKGILHILWTLL